MSLLIRKKLDDGFTLLADREKHGLKRIAFGVLRLGPEEAWTGNTGDAEAVVTVTAGVCRVVCGGFSADNLGGRDKVFDDRASAVYLPPESDYEIHAGPAGMEAAVSLVRADDAERCPPKAIRPEDVNVRKVGRDNWFREVHDVLDGRTPAGRTLLGETFNPPGNWSSAPPHRHDNDDPPEESDHEEVYWFKTEPEQGFGIIRVYTDDLSLDETIAVRNNDLVLIPRGYHPVAAAPGYRLYYHWTLAGDSRELRPRDDPKHSWIKNKG